MLDRVRPMRWLGWFAVAVIIGQQAGVIFGPLGDTIHQTRWADWIDLLTPYAVVGTALAALLAARTDRRGWLLAALGTVLYVQGHALHLAANSIGNARGNGQPVHLWDEVLGHYVWYGGLFVLVAALARGLVALPRPGAAGLPLAALVGLTVANNGIEGGTPYFSIAACLALAGWGWRHRSEAGLLLVTAFGVGALLMVGWGIYWAVAEGRSFPQFSELGWI